MVFCKQILDSYLTSSKHRTGCSMLEAISAKQFTY